MPFQANFPEGHQVIFCLPADGICPELAVCRQFQPAAPFFCLVQFPVRQDIAYLRTVEVFARAMDMPVDEDGGTGLAEDFVNG